MKKITYLLILLCFITVGYTGCKKDDNANKGTCSDGIKNQNESEVDCGGVCSVCQTCSDGIRNQGETGIDCGGTCAQCPVVYPEDGFYGKNIIGSALVSLKGTVFPNGPNDVTNWYSIAAKLPSGSTIKVRLTCLSSASRPWYYDNSSIGTWKFNSPSANVQEYYNSEQSNPDLKIMFTNTGSARLEVFENDKPEVVQSKIITWAFKLRAAATGPANASRENSLMLRLWAD